MLTGPCKNAVNGACGYLGRPLGFSNLFLGAAFGSACGSAIGSTVSVFSMFSVFSGSVSIGTSIIYYLIRKINVADQEAPFKSTNSPYASRMLNFN